MSKRPLNPQLSNPMNHSKQTAEPPFLKGVYLRDDFCFETIGAAFEPDPEPTEPPQPTVQETALMEDDEFLQSLLTPLENQPADEPTNKSNEPIPNEEAVQSNLDSSLSRETNVLQRGERYPFSLNWLSPEFQLEFTHPVTFFVGENGSGKSTLLEAIAELCNFPVSGGGRNDLTSRFGPENRSELARAMFPHFKKRHRDGYFFRAEFYAHFASLLEQRSRDPEFRGDPFMRYGGKSLHARSHGESFLALLQNRFDSGIYLMDEPESALSPQRQLTLLAMIADRVGQGKAQFIIATHSPILMTYPNATIVNFDSTKLENIALEETNHYTLTRDILKNPAMYWQHLSPKTDDGTLN